jgi:uncharacterized membrane protein
MSQMLTTGFANTTNFGQGEFDMKKILTFVATFFEMWTAACYAAHLARNHDWEGAKAVMEKSH